MANKEGERERESTSIVAVASCLASLTTIVIS